MALRPPLRLLFATVTLAAVLLSACTRPPRLTADLIVTHAHIWTGNPAQPDASAVAVIGDRIVDVGSGDAIERWRGVNTTVIDAEGRRLIPGFNDAQVSFV